MAWLTDSRKWDDDWWAGLSFGARMIFEVCLNGQFRTVLPGLCRNVSVLTLHDACTHKIKREHLKPTIEQTQDAVAEALEPDDTGKRHILFDAAARVVRIPMAPAYNHADNPNVLTAWYRAWRDIPDCALKFDHIASLRLGVNFAYLDKHQRHSMAEKWEATFGQPEKAYLEGGIRLKTYVDLKERWVPRGPAAAENGPESPQTSLAFPPGNGAGKGSSGKQKGAAQGATTARPTPVSLETEGDDPQQNPFPPGFE